VGKSEKEFPIINNVIRLHIHHTFQCVKKIAPRDYSQGARKEFI
jgi:hypothetical protein